MKKILASAMLMGVSLGAYAHHHNECPNLTGAYDSCKVIEYVEGYPMGMPTAEGSLYTIEQMSYEGGLNNETFRISETNTTFNDSAYVEINPFEIVAVGETRSIPTGTTPDETMNLTEVSCKDNTLNVKISGEGMDTELGAKIRMANHITYEKDGDDLIITDEDEIGIVGGEMVKSKIVTKCLKK